MPYFSGAPSSRRFAPWRDCLCTLIPGDLSHFFSCLDPVLASGGGSSAECMEVRPHSVGQSAGRQLDAGGGLGHRQNFLDDTCACPWDVLLAQAGLLRGTLTLPRIDFLRILMQLAWSDAGKVGLRRC